jgi:hypothetical protein
MERWQPGQTGRFWVLGINAIPAYGRTGLFCARSAKAQRRGHQRAAAPVQSPPHRPRSLNVLPF